MSGMSLQNEWNEYRMSGISREWMEWVKNEWNESTEWVEWVYRMSGISTEWMEWVYRMNRIENLQIFCRFQFSLNVSDISINGFKDSTQIENNFRNWI